MCKIYKLIILKYKWEELGLKRFVFIKKIFKFVNMLMFYNWFRDLIL